MPVSKKLKFIFLKRYRSGLFYSLYNFVLSFGYGENKKNWLSKLKFPKLFSSCFMNACSKKINVYIFEKISFWTILQSTILFSHLVTEKIKKIDCQNWNFQNCFPHISWTPVPKKKKIFIFLKRYSSGLLYSIYHFVLSHLVRRK